jgi:hypothetical protein
MSNELNPRQKNLIELMPKVEAGEISMVEAMKRAGYADSTAHQQQSVLGAIRNNTKMQEALQKAGFTEDYLATGIVEGTTATEGEKAIPDYRARGIFYKLGAELLDAFPAKKTITADVGIADLIKSQESSTSDGDSQS